MAVFDASGHAQVCLIMSSDAIAWDAITARPSGGYYVIGTTVGGEPIDEALDAGGDVDATGCQIVGTNVGLYGIAGNAKAACGLGGGARWRAPVCGDDCPPISVEVAFELDRYTTACAPDASYGNGGVVQTTIGSTPSGPRKCSPPAAERLLYRMPDLGVIVVSNYDSEHQGAALQITTFDAANGTQTQTPTPIATNNAHGPNASIGIDGVVTAILSFTGQITGESPPMNVTVVKRSDGDDGDGQKAYAGLIADSAETRWNIPDNRSLSVLALSREGGRIVAQGDSGGATFTATMARSDGSLFAAGTLGSNTYVACFATP